MDLRMDYSSIFLKAREKMEAIRNKLAGWLPIKAFSIQPAKEILSIDLDSHSLRLVTVRKEGEKVIISSCDTIERPHGDFDRDISSIFKGKNDYSGPGIIITNEVRFLASELNMPNVDKLPYEKVISMVSWEMEPYLDFPISKGLFSYKFQPHKPKVDTSPVLICALNKETYSDFYRTFKGCGLSLHHAYSSEAAFLSGFALPPKEKSRVVIDCRDTSVKGIILTSEGPSVFQDIPSITEDTTFEKAIRDLIYDLISSLTGERDIIIAGSRASEELVDILKMEFEDLRLWNIQDLEDVEVNPDLDCGPKYAAAIGAALQELGKEPFGVTGKVSLKRSAIKLVRGNEYILPALGLSLFFLCVASHYAIVKVNMSKLSSEIISLKKEESRLMRPVEEKKKMEQEIAEIDSKRRYIEGLSATKHLPAFLDGILEIIPDDLVLRKISQNPDDSFTIEARVLREGSAADFCEQLSELDFCREARIEKFNQNRQSPEELFPHGVIIFVKLK